MQTFLCDGRTVDCWRDWPGEERSEPVAMPKLRVEGRSFRYEPQRQDEVNASWVEELNAYPTYPSAHPVCLVWEVFGARGIALLTTPAALKLEGRLSFCTGKQPVYVRLRDRKLRQEAVLKLNREWRVRLQTELGKALWAERRQYNVVA